MLGLPFLFLLGASLGSPMPPKSQGDVERAMAVISGDAMLDHIKRLSSDEFEGRAPGSHGDRLTVKFLEDQIKKIGLLPAAPDGTFEQVVPLRAFQSHPSSLILKNGGKVVTLETPSDFVARSRVERQDVSVKGSPLVFAGYGISAPDKKWDDYKGLDVKGKTLLLLDGEPQFANGQSMFAKLQTRYGTRQAKIDDAARRGAVAVLFIHDPKTAYANYQVVQNNYRQEFFDVTSSKNQELLSMEGWIALSAAKRTCKNAGFDFNKLRASASGRNFKPVTMGIAADFKLRNVSRTITSKNVIAMIEGSDPKLKSQYVIYSAHWDHLGRDVSLQGDQIFNGAIDNAGGSSQMLEIARAFAALRVPPKRSILFIWTTGEEKGYLGSKYFLSHPFFPVRNAVADINLDNCNVWGRTRDVNDLGFGFTTIDTVLENTARKLGRKFTNATFDGGSYYYRSDQIEFAKVGIPSVFPGSGTDYIGKPAGYGDQMWNDYGANAYHQVSDEVQPDWDMSGAVEDAQWMFLAGYQLAQAKGMPAWKSGSGFGRS